MKRRTVATLIAGVLFGAGLLISGMTDPRNVIGFLDLAGDWNPRLVAVMAGAVAVHASLLALLAPIVRGARSLPARNRRIDPALVAGAAIFGVGWGLSGYCPGPAIVSLGFGARTAIVFVAAMVAGGVVAGVVRDRRPAARAGGCDTP